MPKENEESKKGESKKPTLVDELENDLKTNEYQLMQVKAKIMDLEDELVAIKNNAKTIDGIILALKAVIEKSKKE